MRELLKFKRHLIPFLYRNPKCEKPNDKVSWNHEQKWVETINFWSQARVLQSCKMQSHIHQSGLRSTLSVKTAEVDPFHFLGISWNRGAIKKNTTKPKFCSRNRITTKGTKSYFLFDDYFSWFSLKKKFIFSMISCFSAILCLSYLQT